MHQIPCILGIVLAMIMICISEDNCLWSVVTGLVLFSVVLMALYGETDFSKVILTGPYEVGYKEFRTRVLDNEVSVFYPISKAHHSEKIQDSNTLWLRHGHKTLLGIAKAGNIGGVARDTTPVAMVRYLRDVKMDTIFNGDIDTDFVANKKIIPIIFCHGVSGNRTMNSGNCRDLASHGYMVFSLDHKDETCTYHEDKDGKGYWYNNSHSLYDNECRLKQILIRE